MKTYTIKYETYNGDCECVTIRAFDRQSAINQLINCKVIYWCVRDYNPYELTHS